MWNYSDYGNDLNITKNDAHIGSHQGQCDDDVKFLMSKPYIKRQLNKLNAEKLKKELSEYGAWEDTELENHEDNLMRWLWISCGNILESRR